MHLVHVVAGTPPLGTVLCDSSPHRILHDQHADLFQLFAEILDVVADKAIGNVHVRPVIEDIQRTGDIDFKCRCNGLGLRLLLFEQRIVEILQNRHVVLAGMLEIKLIDLVNTAVDDRLLYRLQTFLATHDQLT